MLYGPEDQKVQFCFFLTPKLLLVHYKRNLSKYLGIFFYCLLKESGEK